MPESLPCLQPSEEEEEEDEVAVADSPTLRPVSTSSDRSSVSHCSKVTLVQEPETLQPIFVRQLPNVELEGLLEKLQLEDDSWPIAQLLHATVGAFDLQPSSWVEACPPSSGTSVRHLRFQMVMPNDVPGFVVYLTSMPETSSCSMACRLHHSDDKLVLVQQVCTHDVTFGENFRTQDTLSFEKNPAGGVIFKKYFEVIWVAPLAWTHVAIKTFVETKAKSSSLAAAEYLVQILEDDGSSVIGQASISSHRCRRSMSRLSEQEDVC